MKISIENKILEEKSIFRTQIYFYDGIEDLVTRAKTHIARRKFLKK